LINFFILQLSSISDPKPTGYFTTYFDQIVIVKLQRMLRRKRQKARDLIREKVKKGLKEQEEELKRKLEAGQIDYLRAH